ncbi:MAG: BREX-1 system adenine-specific DNA-methyltransferase PglX [Muribaculaceae bacterium]|nr:BREX-1 system adenine-specific DNA-methyltransferase PglX [Muribaculaceae bacterium]
MNTNSLKRFATAARNLLMQGVRNRLKAVGFNDDGSVRVEPKASGSYAIFDGQVINDSRFVARWNALRDRIASHGVKQVVEEAAYTWFNRLMAIRILEYNSLAPALLDYENPEVRIPRIVTDARAGKTPVLSDEDRASLEAVISDGRLSFEQFSLLIRAYCENNPIIRKCFGGITDYTALLLPADILAEDGFIDLLNRAGEFIEPDDYRKPELIGWLYQFYIAEKKDEVFAKKGGYDSAEIPAATQIFTPNWIVKYMVENTLGRIYLDNNPDSTISENWKYLVMPAEPTPDDAILRYNSLEDLKCGDLSCGSGHILNEMFDLLYALYAEDFYSPREAIEAILTKNMVGIDLDDRARQLAQFALLLKACQTDTAFADGHCMPRIYSMPEVDRYTWRDLKGHFNCAYQIELPSDEADAQIAEAFELMADADVLGSIMKFEISGEGVEYLSRAVFTYDAEPMHTDSFTPLVDAFRVILALTDKYAALCMNPPYMPTNKEATLKSYATKEYPDSKADLFAIFMDVAIDRLREHGKYGMINMQSWMFLSSFESLRKDVIDNQQIDSLLHLGPRTFDELSGEVVQNAAFIISKEKPTYPGIYYRLIDGANCNAKREMFYVGINRYIVSDQKQFEQIPGAPIAYWVSVNILSKIFTGKIPLDEEFFFREGIHTADNARFTRLWYEVHSSMLIFDASSYEDIDNHHKRWIPYNKGGGARKWYGNNDVVIGFDAPYREQMSALKGHVRPSESLYFQAGGTWSSISTKGFALRYFPKGFLFDAGGQVAIPREGSNIKACLAYLNSNTFDFISRIVMPTINNKCGIIKTLPNLCVIDHTIFSLVDSCINISKQDWDAHETSWDFEISPLLAQAREMPTETNVFSHHREADIEILYPEYVRCDANLEARQHTIKLYASSLYSLYIAYRQKWTRLFAQLQSNEIEINRQFIDIYGLQDELSPNVGYEDITILQQGEATPDGDDVDGPVLIWNKDVIIKQFISYAVGCMMGRYRLDRPGLAIAHPNPSADEYAPYTVVQTGKQWWIDDDGIVPMMGEDSPFHDNAANRFSEFVRVALGNEYLTENMNFVRDALGKDVVDYFRSDFYNDHKKMYQNRPIYWMFSSNQKGKRAAFQCLVYMHRMNRFTPEHIRTNYLLPYIEHLAAREADLMAKSSLTSKENKELKQLRCDLDECRDYQLRLHEFADRQIEIDLDDGVVKNYATFAPVLAKLK